MFILINHCYYFGMKILTFKGNNTHVQNTDIKREA